MEPTIVDFPDISSAYKECLYQESQQGMSGMGGWVIMLKALQTPQGLRSAFFCSQLGRLYLAQCLEDARCSVNICCSHDQL